jgi:hypothetical protein
MAKHQSFVVATDVKDYANSTGRRNTGSKVIRKCRKSIVFLGRWFDRRATLSNADWGRQDGSVPFGRYYRSTLFVFQPVPRCQGV